MKFTEHLKNLADVSNLVLIRIFDENQRLLSVIPNLPGKQGSLKVFNHISENNPQIKFQGWYKEQQSNQTFYNLMNTSDKIDFEGVKEGLKIFDEYLQEAKSNPGKHPNIDLLLTVKENQSLYVERIETTIPNLLEKIVERSADQKECDVFIDLLNHGFVRSAEKIEPLEAQANGTWSNLWQPQTYVIDGILNYFKTHDNVRLEDNYWDKIPLKTSHYTDRDFQESGVRYAPGSIVRTGAYIGAQTVIMNMAFVNIGAYIAGNGVMIDGGARVASCAQIGNGVKFGAGSGIEGILEPAGRLPSIIEDNVKVGAMAEISGVIGEGSVIASGVVMASGKKILDEETGEVLKPLEWKVGDTTFLVPVIPPYRLAVGGSILNEDKSIATDAIILKKGDLRDTDTLKHFKKQGVLYS